MDASTLIALGALAVTIVGGGSAWVIRFGKIEAAADVARQALEKADKAEADLATFKERVAREYATATMVAAFESRMGAAFDRLGDRIDRLIESRSTATRRTPSGQ